MGKAKKLSAKFVETAPAGFHSDGDNLYLSVDGQGRRRWVLRYKLYGRQRDMGLGAPPLVPLSKARESAFEARQLLAQGKDPIDARRASEAGRRTFGEVADELIDSMVAEAKGETKNLEQWRVHLGDKFCKSLRKMYVGEIQTHHVLAVVKPVWLRLGPTARLLRARIEKVLHAAKAAGLIAPPWSNPAAMEGNLEFLLPAKKSGAAKHHDALPFERIPEFMEALRGRRSHAALAIQIVVLTCVRAGELLKATPAEFDFEKRIWNIPASRMKARREHRVPLSDQAIEIIKDAMLLDGAFLIPGKGKPGRPMTSEALVHQINAMGFPTTCHGLRSSFRDWCGETTTFPREIAEAALAHAVGNAVEQAYRRGDALERRRVLMQAWADFATSAPVANNVIPLRAAQ